MFLQNIDLEFLTNNLKGSNTVHVFLNDPRKINDMKFSTVSIHLIFSDMDNKIINLTLSCCSVFLMLLLISVIARLQIGFHT
jgi:hypothetical protein